MSAESLDWQALIETALTAPGSVGNVYSRFYPYSFTNQMLLMMQGVMEPVATYKRWQDLGRQVLKGSKAKQIIRPVILEQKDEAGDVESRSIRFKAVRCLFGLSETEGDELPPPPEPPDWSLDTALQTLDIKRVTFQHLDGNCQGYSTGREYAINPIAANPTRTTYHELGHIVLGHTESDELAEYQHHRGIKEFQAEATSFLTMNELELITPEDASHSRGYIQHWMRDERPPDTAIRQVFTATDKILRAGRATVSTVDGPTG